MSKIERVEAAVALLTERMWEMLATVISKHPYTTMVLLVAITFGPLFLAASWE